jgi:hypothetical protein
MSICSSWVQQRPGSPEELACCFEEGHPGPHMDAVDDLMWELATWPVGQDRPEREAGIRP